MENEIDAPWNDRLELEGDALEAALEESRTAEMLAEAPEAEAGFPDDYPDPEPMDGDMETGLASAGFGTDEDYGYFGGEDSFLDGSYEM